MSLLNSFTECWRSVAEKVCNGFRPSRARSIGKPQAVDYVQETMFFDPNLLDRVKNLWVFGDFKSLAATREIEMMGHPQRGLIAAYVGAAVGQIKDDQTESTQWMQRARDWGCPSDKLMEVYLANVHVSLTDAMMTIGDHEGATEQLTNALSLTSPGVPIAHVLALRVASLRNGEGFTASALSVKHLDGSQASEFFIKENESVSARHVDLSELERVLNASLTE